MSTSSVPNQGLSVPNSGVESVPVQSPKSDLDGLVEMLELSELQKHFMRSRWLDQVQWMEGKAGKAKKRYYTLRLTTIIGGVLVPIIISMNFNNQRVNNLARWISISLGGLVAISSAVDEFFHYGERWQHYRRTTESLKIQGWQFSQLSGLYQTYETHKQAFPAFASHVENILQHDVEVYMTQVEADTKEENKDKPEQAEDTSKDNPPST
jgi:hypothetical protein